MSINIRTKGAEGEREIQKLLEPIVRKVMEAGGYPVPDKPIIQRNQNQSAVGGSDLSNTFGLCIEVKRQEQLAIGTWWAQCVAAASTNEEWPVLLYRQNGKKWSCVTNVWLQLPNTGKAARAEFDMDTFLAWFEEWVTHQLRLGYSPRV